MSSAGNTTVPVHKVFEYDLKKTLPIETHIANIHKSLIPLGYPIEDEPSLFCLQLSAALTTSETPVYFSFDPAVEALVMKSESKRPLLLFTLRPQVKAKRVADVLRSMLSGSSFRSSTLDGSPSAGRAVSHSLKEEVFLLKNLLHVQSPSFSSFFIFISFFHLHPPFFLFFFCQVEESKSSPHHHTVSFLFFPVLFVLDTPNRTRTLLRSSSRTEASTFCCRSSRRAQETRFPTLSRPFKSPPLSPSGSLVWSNVPIVDLFPSSSSSLPHI